MALAIAPTHLYDMTQAFTKHTIPYQLFSLLESSPIDDKESLLMCTLSLSLQGGGFFPIWLGDCVGIWQDMILRAGLVKP